MTRKVVKAVRGQQTVDGAGVHLVRVLGNSTVEDFDPFLMLDSFDSTNPKDYIKGFPFHPHRGIETITYLIEGEMIHEDSLGNKGVIHPGEAQWMTAGSGIMHQEMPQPSNRMLGAQIWLNLPQKQKMSPPHYFDIKKDMIGVREADFGTVRVIAGEYEGCSGVIPPHHYANLYDVSVSRGKSVTIRDESNKNVFIFLILGQVIIDGESVPEKTAILFGQGDAITVGAYEGDLRFIYFAGEKINEPVAWGGPIVMNTRKELITAFDELDRGTFIKSDAKK
jgi:redox-sensitive bicupin YhaK (pirin superfamily)